MSTTYIVGGLLVIAVGGGGYYYYLQEQKRYASNMARDKIERDMAYEQLNRQQQQQQQEEEDKLKQADVKTDEARNQHICKIQTVNDLRDYFMWYKGGITPTEESAFFGPLVHPNAFQELLNGMRRQAGCS